jgi:GAF domain-containing protein
VKIATARPVRSLTVKDLESVTALAAADHAPAQFYRAVENLAQDVLGHTLFTVMAFDADTYEVERVHSSNLGAYSVGGRKPKRGTPWGKVVLDQGEIFIAHTPDEVRDAFTDHALIFSLGIGSIMNVPIGYRGRRLGTMNLSHEAGWYRNADHVAARAIGALFVSALLMHFKSQ